MLLWWIRARLSLGLRLLASEGFALTSSSLPAFLLFWSVMHLVLFLFCNEPRHWKLWLPVRNPQIWVYWKKTKNKHHHKKSAAIQKSPKQTQSTIQNSTNTCKDFICVGWYLHTRGKVKKSNSFMTNEGETRQGAPCPSEPSFRMQMHSHMFFHEKVSGNDINYPVSAPW